MFVIRKGVTTPKFVKVIDEASKTLYCLVEVQCDCTKFETREEAEAALRRSPWRGLRSLSVVEHECCGGECNE